MNVGPVRKPVVLSMRVHDFAKRFRRSDAAEAVSPDSHHPASPTVRMPKTRRRLFTKYVALFVIVVCIALVLNGIFDVLFYFTYSHIYCDFHLVSSLTFLF